MAPELIIDLPMRDAPAGDPFAGGGEMRERCRALDWSATSLGPPEQWSATLRTIVRTALESPFPINLWCGPELVLIYNDAYRHVLADKHPHALGRPGAEVWTEIWDQIAPMFAQIRAGGPPAFAEDAPFVIDRPGPPLPGQEEGGPNAWFTFSLSAVRDDEGEIVAFLNVVSESTGRVLAERATEAARARAERAEARLREVFVHAPAFLAVLRGPEQVFEYVNAAYYQLVGHRELLGLPLFEAIPEVRGQGFEELLRGVLETGEPFVGREVPVTVSRTPGSRPEQVFLDLVYYPINEADGTRSGVVAHGSDVTSHVLARREAQRARAEAEEANQAKSHFLAMMSHEIRTPINAVMGYTDLLDAGVAGALSAPQQEYVQRIRTSSRHLLGLVNDVLDLAKIEAGEMVVLRDEVAVRAVAFSALQMVAAQAEARGISLRDDWRCDGLRFTGDEDRARQVVLNLLSNAVKFTPAGGTVTVRCRREDHPDAEAALPADSGPWLAIDVEDTGSGIPEDQLSRIFEPFVQAEGGHTRRAGGTGLGLTISRRFARLMGGDLSVRSTVDVGSCFTLWLVPVGAGAEFPGGGTDGRRDAGRAVAGLGALGQALLAAADQVEEMLVDRLMGDPGVPGAVRDERSQLANHTAALLSAMGRSLCLLDSGAAEADLQESEEIQEMLAGRHGRQRRRLGWAAAQLEREYALLAEAVGEYLTRHASAPPGADVEGTLEVVRTLLDRARTASLAAYNGDPEPRS